MLLGIGLAIPLIATILLVLFFRKQTRIIEILVLWLISLSIIFLAKSCAEKFSVSETEYWGEYGVKVEYYEEWDEWITQICTREVPCGTDANGNTTYCTETYDCSYRQYHYPRWEVVSNLKNSYDIPEKTYKQMLYTWNNEKFVDMNRDYYTIDGNKYESYWDKKDYNIFPIITTHSYENRVAHASSVYEFPEVDTSKFKLFEYPKVKDYYCQSILSEVKSSDIKWADKLLTNYNALYGVQKQVRMWLLIYKNKPYEYGVQQENYWKRGNKNEVVVCIGVTEDSLTVDWAKVFSWTERENVKVDLEDMIRNQKKLDIYKTVTNIKNEVVEKFERKSFKDFDYLDVEPSTTATILGLIFILLVVGGLTVFIIMNDITNDDESRLYNKHNRKEDRLYTFRKMYGGNKWKNK